MYVNHFQELEALLELRRSLFYCRSSHGLRSMAVSSVEYDFPSVSALMEEGMAWKRLKTEALEELELAAELRNKPGKAAVNESIQTMQEIEEDINRSYNERLQEKLTAITHLEREIQSSIQEAAVESFRTRQLENLHHRYYTRSSAEADDCSDIVRCSLGQIEAETERKRGSGETNDDDLAETEAEEGKPEVNNSSDDQAKIE